MLERIFPMLKKELIQVLRDPKTRGVLFVAPLIQMMIFGYAVTTDVRHIATAIYDLDHSVASRELVSRFIKSGYFDLTEHVWDEGRARQLLDSGKVRALLRFNRGFEADLHGGGTAHVQVIVDGTDSNTAGIVLSYSNRILSQFSEQILLSQMVRVRGAYHPPGQVELETRAWFNQNLESRNFYVPGVIALIVMLVTLMLTSIAVVREKEIGTIEQIMVTPITRWEFILGKTLPFALIGLADMVLVAVVGVFWFGVPIRGNPFWLLVSVLLYLMTTLGIGLLISTISRTQQQAMMTTFLFFSPAVLLSGFIFPIANMPPVIQALTYLDPLRYFLVIIRGVFLKGIGVDILWPQMAGLAILGTATLWLATRRFHKTNL
ncbi:MAG: ABC transporter permease [Verrucomicrobiia bacterium]